jgi:hypothetical protein
MPQPSPLLIARKADVTRLITRWNDALADSIAAVNLFMDLSRDRRKTGIDTLLSRVGTCRAANDFDVVENALRGEWTIPCERGVLRVWVTLAPTMPPRVQYLAVNQVPTAEPPKRRGICTG